MPAAKSSKRRSALPTRWIKGFAEVQAYQPALKLKFEVAPLEARQFVRSVPRGGGAKTPSWVTPIGRGLRLSQRESKDAVRVMGTDRLHLLEGLINDAKKLRVWSDDSAGTSAWEVVFNSGRFVLMISPEIWRGFSGEGQMLDRLAGRDWEARSRACRPSLRGRPAWMSMESRRSSLTRPQIDGALAMLGVRGLVGYDMTEGAYFHRELPFDVTAAVELQPRLKDARKLVAEKKGAHHAEGG